MLIEEEVKEATNTAKLISTEMDIVSENSE